MSYSFTTDWFSKNISHWEQHVSHFSGKPNLNFLEIGCFQGRATVWMLENLLTHESSKITCIDTFEGSSENTPEQSKDMYQLFLNNVSKFSPKVTTIKGSSFEELRKLEYKEQFDLVYVDGDHKASSVLQDAVLSFSLLKSGGMMIFDDYLWRVDRMRDVERPQLAIDSFLQVFSDQITIVSKGYQVFIRKN